MRDVVARTADGKLFHARGAATDNARSPKVDRRTGGTVSNINIINVNVKIPSRGVMRHIGNSTV